MVETVTALAIGQAATATAASTAGLFGTAGTFSLMSTISTLGTVGSIFSTISGSQAAKAQAESEARLSEFNAKQEEIRGKEEAARIKKDVARAIASANARGAASGIDISSGSPVTASKQALRDANEALSISRTNTTIRAETDRVRAQIARRRGANLVRSGQAKAVSLIGDFAMDQRERGVF